MNGGIFMIVAKISCSPTQKETKKLPVMWVPAAENDPFQKMFSGSEGDIWTWFGEWGVFPWD